MSSARLTIVGLYNYDSTVFDNLTVPAAIDRDTLINNILLKGGSFELLYPDLEFLKMIMGTWSSKHYKTFEKWATALDIEYDPLNNYDRTEEWTTKDNSTTNISRSTTGNSTDAMTATGNSNTATDTTENNKISAFNSSTMQNNTQSVLDSDVVGSTHDSSTSTSETETETTGTDTAESTQTRTGRAYGNIGVTTSQQMLEAELEVAKWNLIDHITDLWLEEFVIPVY